MRLAFRVDASRTIGGGHVMRCLALADAARQRGDDSVFVCRPRAGDLRDAIERAGFAVRALPDAPEPCVPEADAPGHAPWLGVAQALDAEDTVRALEGDTIDWLVVDHYGIGPAWIAALRSRCGALQLLAIDDLDDRPLDAELLLDQTRLGGRHRAHAARAMLIGPSYALLRPEFAALRSAALQRRAAPVRRLLVTPGMMDEQGLGLAAIDAAQGLALDQIDVAVGRAASSYAALAARAGPALQVHPSTPDIARLMQQADLAVGAGGMSSWERCCLGLPGVVVDVAANQTPVCEALAARGAALHLPLAALHDGASLHAALARLVGDAAMRQRMSAAAAALCDGRGADRVLDAMQWTLRDWTSDDELRLLRWRDTERVRLASHHSGRLDAQEHSVWFARTMARSDGLWFIYREGAHDLGQINAVDQGAGGWRWSFYIGADDAPPGAGARMTAHFLRRLFGRGDVARVGGEVRAGNIASRRLHERLGFVGAPRADGQVVDYVLTRDAWQAADEEHRHEA